MSNEKSWGITKTIRNLSLKKISFTRGGDAVWLERG